MKQSENKPENKSDKYFAVSRAILEIIEAEGEEHLTHSKISRLSNVSRAWIYEYMGKEKSDLIDVASDIFASYFTKASTAIEVKNAADFEKILSDSQEQAFQKIKEEPVIIKLYFRYKGTSTPIGTSIKKYEKHWLDFMSSNFERALKYDAREALSASRALLTLRLGFYHRVAASNSPAKEIIDAKEALELIQRQLFS